MKRIRLFENDGNVNWEEVVENIFFDNYVAGNPDKFLTALENELEKLGYPKPTQPLKFDNFGGPKGEKQIINNFKALKSQNSDRQNRTIDRIVIDTLVNKFFKGDEKAAGEAYQNWISKTRNLETRKDYDGSDFKLFTSIDDIPIWTPNEDVVDFMGNKFYLTYLFGGKYYKNYEYRDKKAKEDLEYRENREKGMYRDVCPRCQASTDMKWVNSEDDYPKGMISKEEFCSKCNPSGKPLPMFPQHYLIDCDICGVIIDNESEQEKTKKYAEYWKGRMDGYEGVANKETNPTYLEYKKQYEFFKKKQDINEAKKCNCSFEKLKAVYDRYLEYEDYDSLANMQKNPLYRSFFNQLNGNQNLQEQIKRIKGIMFL